MDTDLLTIRQAATLVQRDPETVRRWVRSGRLEASPAGGKGYLIPRAALASFLGLAPEHVGAKPPAAAPRYNVTPLKGSEPAPHDPSLPTLGVNLADYARAKGWQVPDD